MKKKFFEIEEHKNKLAIIDEKIGNLYYSDLLEIGSKLHFNDIKEKKLIFIICKNNYESIAGYISFLRSKTAILLLHYLINEKHLKNLIKIYHPDYIFCPEELKTIFPDFKEKNTVGSYCLLQTNLEKDFIINENLALLLTTSGSTGSPQVVRQSYENIISNSNSICNFLKIKSSDRAITTLPMNYTYSLSIINSHILKGGSLVLTEKSIIMREFWESFKKNKVTTFGGVPYTFEILKKIKFENMNLPSLKYITQAGGKLDMSLIDHFYKISKKKKIKLIIMYGQTEATSRMSYLKWKDLKFKRGSIGKSINEGKFYLIDKNHKKIIKNNIHGELVYKGNNVCLGYAVNRFDLEKKDENKKILYTGDIAIKDRDGFYYIVGRKKRFIKLFGHRINLDEIEKLIKEIGFTCACRGDDKRIYIFLSKKDQINSEKIKNTLEKNIYVLKNSYKMVFINEIPRNVSGKILYSKLNIDQSNAAIK